MSRSSRAHPFGSQHSALSVNPYLHVVLTILMCFGFIDCVSAQSAPGAPAVTYVVPETAPTWDELQKQIDDLEQQVDTVNYFLKKEALDIFESSDKGLNSAADASLGTFFLTSDEREKIEQTILQAEDAARNAELASKQAENAFKSGQHYLATAKTLEAAKFEAEASSKFKDAFT